jgi:hypothetical protein
MRRKAYSLCLFEQGHASLQCGGKQAGSCSTGFVKLNSAAATAAAVVNTACTTKLLLAPTLA